MVAMDEPDPGLEPYPLETRYGTTSPGIYFFPLENSECFPLLGISISDLPVY